MPTPIVFSRGTWAIVVGSLLLCTITRGATPPDQTEKKSTVCATNQSAEVKNPAISDWCSQQDSIDQEIAAYQRQLSEFNSKFTALHSTSAAAADIYKQYVAYLTSQIAAGRAIHDKLETIIEVQAMLPMLPASMAQANAVETATLQVDLVGLTAKYETAKLVPPDTAAKPSPKPTTAKGSGSPDETPKTDETPKENSEAPTEAQPKTAAGSAVENTVTVPSNNGGIVINATALNNPPPAAPVAQPAPPSKTPGAPAPAKKAVPAPANQKPKQNGPTNHGTDQGSGGAAGTSGTDNNTGNTNKKDKGGSANPATGITPATDPAKTPTEGKNEAAGTGVLTGRIIDDLKGEPIENAVVRAYCGTKGESEFTTRTASNGRYIFTSLPVGKCVIRAAKFLSQAETDNSSRKFYWNRKINSSAAANELDFYQGIHGISTNRFAKKTLAGQKANLALNNAEKSFEEKIINSVDITSGVETIAGDLRLTERNSTIGEFARTVVGFQQAGVSSGDSAQKFFFDLYLSIPLVFVNRFEFTDPNFGPKFRVWGDMRVTSAPQQIQSSLGAFAVGFAEQVGNLKVNQVAQAAEFVVGGEQRLMTWGEPRMISFDKSARERFGAYAIASFGRITTLNPSSTIQVFNNPVPGSEPNFDSEIAKLGLTSQLAGKQYVAFVSQDRFKFYKEYYAGFRLKTYYYAAETDEPLKRFPATLDVVFGQNESITGGRIRGITWRLEGFYPLPFEALKYIYLFGTSDMVIGGPKSEGAIILQTPATTPTIPDPSVLLISSPQLRRDQYRIGAGIDFIQLVSQLKTKNLSKPTTPAPAAKDSSNSSQGE